MRREKNYPWDRILTELQARPEHWRLFPEMVARPASLARRIRVGGVRALRAPDGAVQTRVGWSGVTTEGRTVADVYLRWVPDRPGGEDD